MCSPRMKFTQPKIYKVQSFGQERPQHPVGETLLLWCFFVTSLSQWLIGGLGWWFGYFESPYEKELLLSDTPGIPYHQSNPPIYLWLNLREKTRMPVFTCWMFPKIVGFPPKSSILIRAFCYKPSILGGNTPIFGFPPKQRCKPYLPAIASAGTQALGGNSWCGEAWQKPGTIFKAPATGRGCLSCHISLEVLGRTPFFSQVGFRVSRLF